MIPSESFFTLGNLLFFIASVPLIREAYLNRKSLSGYSRNGAILTTGGMLAMIFGFADINAMWSVLFAVPTLAFWIIVSYYKVSKTK